MKPYNLFRSLLFRLNPETAHNLTINLMRLSGDILPFRVLLTSMFRAPTRPTQAFGLKFTNPIGLAAGYDKDGLGWCGLASLGFGHIEIGTVTPRPQPGNPKPRLFRLPEDQAFVNRMGFPGRGVEFVLNQISKPRPKNLILGVNIGKNKDTPLETASGDYIALLKRFANQVDYLTINVSSPNTIGLRQLQERQALDELLRLLDAERLQILGAGSKHLPLLVKISPDLTDAQLDDALEVILLNHMDGIIATNTTIARNGLSSSKSKETGGLSGKPLYSQSLTMVKKISTRSSGVLPIIGVGGISDAAGVQEMLDAGATLVQIYTGLVYEGPGLVKNILSQLDQ